MTLMEGWNCVGCANYRMYRTIDPKGLSVVADGMVPSTTEVLGNRTAAPRAQASTVQVYNFCCGWACLESACVAGRTTNLVTRHSQPFAQTDSVKPVTFGNGSIPKYPRTGSLGPKLTLGKLG